MTANTTVLQVGWGSSQNGFSSTELLFGFFVISWHIILNILQRVFNFTPVLAFSHTGLCSTTHNALFSCCKAQKSLTTVARMSAGR